jgi:hypothetical protein
MTTGFNVRNKKIYWNFVQFTTILELKFWSLPGFKFKGDWLLREFLFTNANSRVHQLGQGVIQCRLQVLLLQLSDMHRLTLKIEEDIEFQKG